MSDFLIVEQPTESRPRRQMPRREVPHRHVREPLSLRQMLLVVAVASVAVAVIRDLLPMVLS